VTPLCWPTPEGRCACPKHHTREKEIGKAPLLGTDYQERLLSREKVARFWAEYPSANYGILSKHSGLLVTDADSFDADREVEDLGVPPGPRVKTGNGIHRYFANTAGVVGRTIKRGEFSLVIRCAKDVTPEPIDWLWYPYAPLSKLGVLGGDAGAGKTWLALSLATSKVPGRSWCAHETGIRTVGV
jgi:hypothetical protein